MTLTVVIPAYNAARHIDPLLARVAGLVSSGLTHVVVVDDGSSDDTARRVEGYAPAGFRLSLLRRSKNGGYGAAMKAGLAATRADAPQLVACIHADGQYAPEALPGLLRSRAFSGIVLQTAFTSSIFFAFISGAPYVMAHALHRPPTEYGFYFVIVSGGFMLGNLLALRFGLHLPPRRLLQIGALVTLCGPLLLTAVVLLQALTPMWLFLPMFIGSTGSGAVMPSAQAAAINLFPERAGTASGVSGFLQMVFAATASQLVGLFVGESIWPMLICMLVGGAGAFVALLWQPVTHWSGQPTKLESR